MKKLIVTLLLVIPTLFLNGCRVTEAAYSPGYNNDYVYSVGYYGYRPAYWGASNYGWHNRYWNGYRGYGYRGWHHGGW